MGIWKDKDRQRIRYSFEYRGRRYYGEAATKREARIKRAEHQKRIQEEALTRTETGMDFSVLANEYLDHSKRRHAKTTYKAKAKILGRFLHHAGDRPIHLYQPSDIEAFLAGVGSNNNWNVYRKDLSAFFAWVKRIKRITVENPCGPVERLPHSPAPKKIPSAQDIARMILAADPESDQQDLLLTILHTLGRRDEILRLRWQDVNFEKRAITLWTRKRKDGAYEADVLPMNGDLYELLKRRWARRVQDEWVFFNEQYGTRYSRRDGFMRGICRRAGIQPLRITKRKKNGKIRDVGLYYGFHSLRHFVASHLADKEKISLSALRPLLRHKNLRTTEIYIQSIESSSRDAMNRLEGQFRPENLADPLPASAPAGDDRGVK